MVCLFKLFCHKERGELMDISQIYCSNETCKDYGKKGQGNIVCYETYGKRKTKLLRCRTCKTRFSERKNTVFFGLHTDEETIERVVRCLAEGNSIHATARIMNIDKDTAFRIFDRASSHCKKVLDNLLKDLHMEECQLDELWGFVKKKREESNPYREDPIKVWRKPIFLLRRSMERQMVSFLSFRVMRYPIIEILY
jgi:transposase-like protein